MNQIKQIADKLKRTFEEVDATTKSPNKLTMPYGEGYSGRTGYFRAGNFEDLKVLVEYVKHDISQDEWRKGMNLIAQERKQHFGIRPNPLYVAMQEAEAVLSGYEKRQEMLKDKTDYTQIPEELRPEIPEGLDNYAFEKIEGLIGLVSVLNNPAIKGIQFQFQFQHQTQEQ